MRERTGLVLDPYFSGTKIEWLLRNVDGLRERARDGRAVFGTVDAWLIFKLTGEHVTDPSNASRTLLYDIARGRAGTPSCCALLGDVPSARCREVAAELRRARRDRAPRRCTATRRAGRRASPATSRRRCSARPASTRAMGKNTYGTGSFVLLNAGDARRPTPRPGLLATVAWQIGERTTYALEAAIFVTGAAVQWLRDGLGIIERGRRDRGAGGVAGLQRRRLLRPGADRAGLAALGPLRARDDRRAHARQPARAHLARATLEAIAYQTVDAVRAMEAAGRRAAAPSCKADGGATRQRLADAVPGRRARRARRRARGRRDDRARRRATWPASAPGCWTLDQRRARSWRERARYEPRMGEDERETLLAGWRRALERARGWAARVTIAAARGRTRAHGRESSRR